MTVSLFFFSLSRTRVSLMVDKVPDSLRVAPDIIFRLPLVVTRTSCYFTFLKSFLFLGLRPSCLPSLLALYAVPLVRGVHPELYVYPTFPCLPSSTKSCSTLFLFVRGRGSRTPSFLSSTPVEIDLVDFKQKLTGVFGPTSQVERRQSGALR